MLKGLDINSVLDLAVIVLGFFIHHAVRKPKDNERADLIRRLADDAAAVVLNLMPNASWAQILAQVVAKLNAAEAAPTGNAKVVEDAATAALVRLGKTRDTAGVQ